MCIICNNEFTVDTTEITCCYSVSVIPDNLVNLTRLYCSFTKITVIPDNLVNLTYLNCRNTKIKYIPFTIKYCNINVIKYNAYYLRKFQKFFRKKQFEKIINDIPMHTNISRYLVMPEIFAKK